MNNKKIDRSKKHFIAIDVTKVLLDHFDKIIEFKGFNRSEVIRALMGEYIEKNKIE